MKMNVKTILSILLIVLLIAFVYLSPITKETDLDTMLNFIASQDK